MKRGRRAAVVGFALASLFLLRVTGPLVAPGHELTFHLPGSAVVLYVPAILDLLLLTVLLTAALLWARRYPRAELWLWSALLLSLPSALLATGYGFSGKSVPVWFAWPVAAAAAVAFLTVNLQPGYALRCFPRVRSSASTLLSLLFFPELLLFLQLFWYGWQSRDLNPPFVPAPQLASDNAAAPQSRVVWIILDELSFEQVYGHRFPGLALPNFDRLASQASVFTQARSAAEYTRTAIPSLLTGQPLLRTQPSADGQTLSLTRAAHHERLTLRASDTIFGDAKRAGLETSIAGWYEPYCRLLPGVLDHCFWTYSDELPAGMSPAGSILANTFAPLHYVTNLCLRALHRGPGRTAPGKLDVERHRADYQRLLAASDTLLNSGQTGLILLHMPIPHPWGFYDRHTDTFPQHRTSYLDNLALADAYIGRVREELEQRHAWDNTTLLVMGDHSWRTGLVWSLSDHWTPEEQAASHGAAYDARPAVLLKLPGQQQSADIHAPFRAVRTRALLKALMTNQISTPEALQRWITANPGP